MEFKEKLLQLRTGKRWTQEELAEALFVSRTAVSKWESGRGYPSIDSLKAISKLFSVSVDELLSNEECIALAETDAAERINILRQRVFGILDIMPSLLLFLPFFGQQSGGGVLAVPLIALTGEPEYMKAAYLVMTAVSILFGVAELAFQTVQSGVWARKRTPVSLGVTVFGVMAYMLSRQPYAGAFLLCILVLKGILLIKRK